MWQANFISDIFGERNIINGATNSDYFHPSAWYGNDLAYSQQSQKLSNSKFRLNLVWGMEDRNTRRHLRHWQYDSIALVKVEVAIQSGTWFCDLGCLSCADSLMNAEEGGFKKESNPSWSTYLARWRRRHVRPVIKMAFIGRRCASTNCSEFGNSK